MGGNSPEEERRFATAARISEINLSLYRAFVQPMVKGFVTPPMVEWLKRWHPVRMSYEAFTRCQSIHAGAWQTLPRRCASNRKPAAADNPFLSAQEQISSRSSSRSTPGGKFRRSYPSRCSSQSMDRRRSRLPLALAPKPRGHGDPEDRHCIASLWTKRIAELKSLITKGGLQECTIRGLIYVGMARGFVDERGVAALRRIRLTEEASRMTLAQFKATAREQFFLLLLEPEAALAAIPKMLPADVAERRKGLAAIRNVLSAGGEISGEAAERLTKGHGAIRDR